MERTVRPAEVVATLAEGRPPRHRSVTLHVPAPDPSDLTTLESMLQSIITEVITSWPPGTTWIVELDTGYLQGITYTPTCLLEFGPPPETPELWGQARQAGWIDPHTVPAGHSDFASRPVWGDNPVQEVSFASTGIPAIVATLADAVDSLLRARRRQPLTIRLFCNRDDDDEPTEIAAESLVLPIDPVGVRVTV